MKNPMKTFSLAGREGAFLLPDGEGPFPVALLCGEDPELLPDLGKAAPGVLLLAPAACWERDLTPWPAPELPGRAPFSGGAPRYLTFLLEELLPWAQEKFPLKKGPENTALLGYSLAGLFAFWSAFQTNAFGVLGSLSGSFWYDGLEDYWNSHLIKNPQAQVYLSLGRSEGRVGPVRMRSVEEKTQRAAAALTTLLGENRVFLEWNRGGHFTGVSNRWKKALAWTVGKFSGSTAPLDR